MRYAYVVENNIIEGPVALPNSWQNISGFSNLNDEKLRSYGWLPWRLVETEGEVLVGSSIEITATEVIETQIKRAKTPEEIAAEEKQKKDMISMQRLQAYREESDPLFFKAQRGEATIEEWHSKVEEIKARYIV